MKLEKPCLRLFFFGELIMKKFALDEIKQGALLAIPTAETLEFILHGEKVAVDVHIAQLSYAQTSSYYQAMQKGELESVAPEWVAKSLVDEKGETLFTVQDVKEKFSRSLLDSAIERILKLNVLDKETLDEDGDDEKKSES